MKIPLGGSTRRAGRTGKQIGPASAGVKMQQLATFRNEMDVNCLTACATA